ncbi:hypothetical protein DYB25_012406 [Aphanomyces astaci]|uniref:PX domain-containing protein n=1 Tax=Aphanomyces astaci TaxID=112090 RepID=A0A397C0E1_APHAT|nr:hypothetical protein DYB25_012406 [Aphanomyces astaci]RHY63267.1 hypothetical protein DYB30_014345 [Aphanomyces astaci]
MFFHIFFMADKFKQHLHASTSMVVDTTSYLYLRKKTQHEPPHFMAFHAADPGDAEYSEYMAAWLQTNATIRSLDNVVLYAVEVNLGKMRWSIRRRYSEFRELRQCMIKHMSKRSSCCMICGAMLQGLEALPFPPKRPSLFYKAGVDLDSRQAKLQEFVLLLVGVIQMLRQHQMLMQSSAGFAKRNKTQCDVSDLLRAVEAFFALDFSRYTRFLAERGVLQPNEVLLA